MNKQSTIRQHSAVIVRVPDAGVFEGVAACDPFEFEGELVIEVRVSLGDGCYSNHFYTLSRVEAA